MKEREGGGMFIYTFPELISPTHFDPETPEVSKGKLAVPLKNQSTSIKGTGNLQV